MGKFGPKSDQFFQQNQTKIGPKCAPNGKNQTLTVNFVWPLITINPSLISCSKQLIISVISLHFGQNQTFGCKIRPFSDLFAQKGPISDQGPRKLDHLGTLV